MIAKIKEVFATDLVKVSFLNAIATLIRMLTGFVSVKVVAVLIGPAGVALVGQLNNFSTIFLNISAGGINSGITRYTAEYRDSEKKFALFLRTGFWTTAVLSLVCGLVLIVFSGYFSKLILLNIKYKSVFIIFGFTIMLYALNAFFIAVLNGFKEFKKYIIINILTSIVGLLFSIVLAVSFGVYGALLSAVCFQSVVFIITVFILVKTNWFKWTNFVGRFSKPAAIKLAHYSLMTLVSTLTVPVSQLIVRNYIVDHQSIDQAGLWEGMNRISGMYQMIILTSLSVYYLPRLSELKSDREIHNEIITVYKFIIPLLLLMALGSFFFRDIIVHILFNNKFIGMRDFFGFQLIGDFLKMLAWTLGYLLLAKAMTKTFIFIEIVFSSSFVFLCVFLLNRYGTIGVTMGYAANNLLQLITLMFIFRRILFQTK